MAAVGPRTSLRIERGNDKRFRGLNAKHTVSSMVEALLQLLNITEYVQCGKCGPESIFCEPQELSLTLMKPSLAAG